MHQRRVRSDRPPHLPGRPVVLEPAAQRLALADRDPTIATATPPPRQRTQTAQKQHARFPYPDAQTSAASIRVPEGARRHTVSLTRCAGRPLLGLIAQKDRRPPRMWTRPVLHEPGFEAALRLALQWPYKWPYSGPSAAGVSGVNAGESRGPCRGSCRANQQVRGSVILARKRWSGTLTRKRSLVQIQYGPLISKTCPPRGSQKGSQEEAELASSNRRDGVH